MAALLIGRPGGANLAAEDHVRYDEAVVSVVRDEEGLDDLPIVAGLDFGHTDSAWTIPIGVPVRVDPGHGAVEFLRAGLT